MNIWDRRAAQAENERNGIKVRIAEYPGIAFTVRPLCDWNAEYLRSQIAVAMRPDVAAYLKRVQAPGYEPTEADKELDKRISIETFVRGCVVAWEGVPAPDGEPDWPFTTENAIAFFEHFPDVYVTVRAKAADVRNFQPPSEDEARDKVAGNSRRASRLKSAAGVS